MNFKNHQKLGTQKASASMIFRTLCEWDTSTTDIEGARNSKKRFSFHVSERHGTLLKILHALNVRSTNRKQNKK